MVRPITFSIAALGLMLSAISLSGCASAIEGSTEDIRVDIAGTGEALCDVTQPGRRYRVYAPSTISVMKSGHPLKIRCAAPGNREQIVTVDPVVSDKTAYNVANLGIGAAWDYATGAFYEYPKRVLIDFTELPGKTYPLPDYQLVLQRHPHMAGMEQFNPGVAALHSDIGQSTPPLPLRDANDIGSSEIMMPTTSSTTTTTTTTSTSETKQPLPPVTAPQVLAPAATTTTETNNNSGNGSLKLFTNKVGTLPSNSQTVTTTSGTKSTTTTTGN